MSSFYNVNVTCHIDTLSSASNHIPLLPIAGGIRCEKSSVYVRSKGFANVYQLEGAFIVSTPHTTVSVALNLRHHLISPCR